MPNAVFRLEDMSPGAPYNTQENLQKLRVIADYLQSQNVLFDVALFPRHVDPPQNYDKSILDTSDPYIVSFNSTMDYLRTKGGQFCLHCFTHQYGNAVSGTPEFYYNGCQINCPPQDSPLACSDKMLFEESYASSRLQSGISICQAGGINLAAWITPDYLASATERCLIASWIGLFFEDVPGSSTGSITILDQDEAFYRGVMYVPTPLGYVTGANPQASVNRICQAISNYPPGNVATFYYHAFLEFQFIQISGSTVIYDDNSYLKQLVRCFQQNGYNFVQLLDIVNFIPYVRQTDFFPGTGNVFLTGDVNGDGKTDFIIWQPATGTWFYVLPNFNPYPNRTNPGFTINMALENWAVTTTWKPLTGDFNGDGKDDIVVWNPQNGNWQVALSKEFYFLPTPSWLNSWAVGSFWVPFVGDFNGDGKDDIAVWNPQSGDWQVALSNGTQFIPSAGPGNFHWIIGFAQGQGFVPKIGDFNGDGKDDIVAWNSQTGNWQVALSNGSQFTLSPGRGDGFWLTNWAIGTNWQPLVGDFNGDGRCDIMVVNNTGGNWQLALSNGSFFSIPSQSVFRPWAAASDMQPFAADFNGDGKADICARSPSLRNGTVDFAVSVLGI